MPSVGPLTQELLKQLIHYDPDTGIITRLTKGRAPRIASAITHGYIQVWLTFAPGVRKKYYGHQLAWLYVYGYLPHKLDHKDRVRSHNWITNLRETTSTLNAYNSARCNSEFGECL